MRKLKHLDNWEGQAYHRTSAHTYLAAQRRLREGAAVVEKDKDRFWETIHAYGDDVEACANQILASVLRAYPYPEGEIRDGRQVARKMRRAANRCQTLARRKYEQQRKVREQLLRVLD